MMPMPTLPTTFSVRDVEYEWVLQGLTALPGLEGCREDGASARRIFRSEQSSVYRVSLPGCGPLIVKVSADREAVIRERRIHTMVTFPKGLHTSSVVGGGRIGEYEWIAYEDQGLAPTPWTRRRWLLAVQTAARVHERLASTEELSNVAVSHTPTYDEVAAVVQSATAFHALSILRGHGFLSRGTCARLRALVSSVQQWTERAELVRAVVVHGDLHLGNWLWCRENRQLHLIDWAFLHMDTPYFDLFQLLDATSATTELRRYGSRLDALATYARETSAAPAMQAFARGYLSYAAAHLVWILTRIAADASTGRFPLDQLRRQTRETVAGLFGIVSDLRRL